MRATPCPSDDMLAAFARNTLTQTQMDSVAGHVVRCSECEQKLGLVADHPMATPPTEQSDTLVPARPGTTVSLGGSLLDERYVLHERLGAGGMGYVYRAEQLKPVRRQVAVKVMRPGMDSDEFLARFEGERRAVARMDHPNIARVFDAGTTTDGRPFLALELVDGPPVTRWCDAARLSTRERVAVLVPVCRAVQHAHLKGVIHRDLKPSNVLVAEVDGRGVPKVIDFGIAKAIGQGLAGHTRTGVVIGTPEYMSPEQAGLTGADVDTRSDVYSLGVMLYELLVGSTPFPPVGDGGSVWELLRRIREEDPPTPGAKLVEPRAAERLADARRCSPDRLRREVGGELRWVVMKALDRDRERRYQSANALADDLERYLRDEPLDAGPPSALYRARKFVARNRGGVMAGGAVLLTLLAAVIGTTAGLVRSLRAEEQARDSLAAEGVARQEAERSADLARQEKEAAVRATATAEQARTAAEQARTAAEQARAASVRAQQRTRDALFAVTEFVAGRSFGREAQVSAAERHFLTGIVTLLRQLGTSEGLTADIGGECLFRVGLLQLRLGQGEEAEKTFAEARTVWEKLHAEDPTATLPRMELVKVYTELAMAQARKNRPAAAEDLIDRALAAADTLAKDAPTVAHLSLAAKVRRLRGEQYVRSGDTKRAKQEIAASVAALERLADEHPDDRVPVYELVAALDMLAELCDRTGDRRRADGLLADSLKWNERLSAAHPEEADIAESLARALELVAARVGGAERVTLLRRAGAVRKELMTLYPAVPQYRSAYAALAANLAGHLCNAGDLKGAEPLAADALAVRTRLAAESPENALNQILLAHSLGVSAQICRLTGKAEKAADLIEQAVKAIDPPFAREPNSDLCRGIHVMNHNERAAQREIRHEYALAADDWAALCKSANAPQRPAARRALCLAKAGRTKEAKAEADPLRKRYERDWLTQHLLARVYAVMAAADPTADHAEVAAGCLGSAIGGGLPDRPEWKWDPDLDPVRGHKEVAAVLARLKAVEQLPPPRPADR